MSDHTVHEPLPAVAEPTMVMMLTGWIDASGAAAAAMDALVDQCDATTMVTFDDDVYIDYRARRPVMELRDGVNTELIWAAPALKRGRDRDGRDLLLLVGPEPDMAWHRFAATVAELAERFGVQRLVGLGAYPFAAPHTRAPRLSATSPSAEVLDDVPLLRSTVDVPAGVAAAIEHAAHERAIPTLGIWAQVPHYVASMSYPPASVALLDMLAEITGITINTDELRREAVLQRQRLDQLVDGNDEHRAMLAQLERLYDETVAADSSDEPATGRLEMRTGEELAQEVERFLREQGKS
jgi:proteasome assembly chaperone (PAC2) family protein